MDLALHAASLSAVVTILALILYTYMGVRVGGARAKYKIEAPAVIGDPIFERTFRVQMNTLEHLVVFLPALWLATIYFRTFPWLPAALGLVWILGRILYMQSYIADPKSRGRGFGIAGTAELVLLILAIAGIAMDWNAGG